MKKLIALFGIILIIPGCGSNLPEEGTFEGPHTFYTQDSTEIIFPQKYEGNILVTGYIFTNCPDICPLTTNNMRLLQEKLKKENVVNVQFAGITFDTEVDKPSRLTDYARARNLDLSNWDFLWAPEETTSRLMKQVGIFYTAGDTTFLSNGDTIKYFVHTDRISLVDQNGTIRKHYKGSELPLQEIYRDILSLK